MNTCGDYNKEKVPKALIHHKIGPKSFPLMRSGLRMWKGIPHLDHDAIKGGGDLSSQVYRLDSPRM